MTATIELACDEAGAVISPIGASLVRFSVGDRPVVVPMNAFDGAVLAPWPNRIDGGHFDFAGDSHRLPITEPERNTALHGLVADAQWSVVERTESTASLEYTLEPTEGYPFAFDLQVDFELAEAVLRMRARALNTGSAPAPFGFGFHPWLSPGTAPSGTTDLVDGALVDEAQLVIPAAHWHETDERLIPTAVRPFDDGTAVPADHASDDSACMVCKDFRALRLIGGTILDDAYGSPRRGDDGWSRARLRGTDLREVVVGMGPGFRTWQACTGDGLEEDLARRAIAIEPMTCPPNAFAAGEAGEDFDVVAPGDELVVEWSIALTEDDDTSCSLPQ
ncbi:aldose 1-epimerase family protein [Brevibacterium sp. JSBI002]|uniref:aldose 1-epimerase family protein n=1 Tax=Brevibacterium sp. JSBI002 TaxID=2886045 RepID=UPI0022303202|nr:aldose 1-epimerase family protein [Brevibacterium sp. JSBI002]UZD61297.1 aldose 1-epimerase family protein [Brevibacterium sp. JSBI002]